MPRCLRRGTGGDRDPRRRGKRETLPIATLSPLEWFLHSDVQRCKPFPRFINCDGTVWFWSINHNRLKRKENRRGTEPRSFCYPAAERLTTGPNRLRPTDRNTLSIPCWEMTVLTNSLIKKYKQNTKSHIHMHSFINYMAPRKLNSWRYLHFVPLEETRLKFVVFQSQFFLF